MITLLPFLLKSSTTQSCPPYILRCSSCQLRANTNYCADTCTAPLLLIPDSGCLPCFFRCSACQGPSPGQCSSCQGGYYYLQSAAFMKCIPCTMNCLVCDLNLVCSTCSDGYFLQKGLCSFCYYTNSLTCQYSKVLTCVAGYAVAQSGAQCSACPLNCQFCQFQTFCDQCLDGYYQDQNNNNLCTSCATVKCKVCSQTVCFQCALGYFLSQNLCKVCPDACYACISLTQCTVCKQTFNLVNEQCQTTGTVQFCQLTQGGVCQTCLAGYFLVSNKCVRGCSILCKTCNSPSFGDCLQCVKSSVLNNKVCTPSNLYDSISYQNYINFVNRQDLYSLVDNSAFQTVVCFQSLLLVPLNKELKIALGGLQSYSVKLTWRVVLFNQKGGTVQAGLNAQYQVYTISTPSFQCEAASTPRLYTANSFSQTYSNIELTNNFFIKGSGQFALAQLLVVSYFCTDSKCLLCSNALNCLQCLTNSLFIQGSSCKLACDSGYYLYVLNGLNYCYLSCPTTSYANNILSQCLLCTNNCQTCQSATNCLSCKASFFLYQTTCLAVCPDGLFADQQIGICQPCSSPCGTCSQSKTRCTSCVSLFLMNFQCQQNCDNQYYPDITTLRCEKCPAMCATCTSLTSCQTCNTGFFFNNGFCTQKCPQFFFQNDANKVCSPCVNDCLSCSSRTTCLYCRNKFLVSATGLCVSTCPSLTYGQITSLSCVNCPTGCLSCINQAICNPPCATNYIFQSSSSFCVQKCTDGFYSGSFTPAGGTAYSRCLACSSNCLTCQTTAFNCLSCSIGYLSISAGVGRCSTSNICPSGQFADISILACASCDLTKCASCLNSATFCISCPNSLPLLTSSTGTCSANCLDGYYAMSASSCQRCPRPCNTCRTSGSTLVCLSCIISYIFTGTSCEQTCPSGFFQNKVTKSCAACSLGCSQCQIDTVCKACGFVNNVAYFLDTALKKCVTTCPTSMYNDELVQQCLSCSAACQTCSSFDTCLTCSANRFQYFGQCLFSCIQGSYVSQRKCLPCSNSCLTCSSSNSCLSCKNGLFYFANSCSQACPQGTFKSVLSCLPCNFPCKTCGLSAIQCLSCLQGALLGSQCNSFCPSGYINLNNVCTACRAPCQQCQGDVNTCTACQANTFLNTKSYTCGNCLLTEYNDQVARICIPCNQPCKACLNSVQCLTCLYGSLSGGICVNSCPAGTFNSLDPASSTYRCQNCGGSCKLCQNRADYCLVCLDLTKFPVNGNCNGQCPVGYYPDFNFKTCSQCPSSCTSCTSLTSCSNCKTGFLFNNQCLSFCPAGFFQSDATKQCSKCVSPCSTCSQFANACTSCVTSSANFLFGSICYQKCPQGTIPVQQSGLCMSCFSPCLSCENEPSKCTSCIPGFLLLEKYCIPGTSCPSGLFLNSQTRSCGTAELNCKGLVINQVTRECSKVCATSYFVLEGKCVESCPKDMMKSAQLACVPKDPTLTPLQYQVTFFIKDNILQGLIEFNQDVIYTSSVTNRSLLLQSGNSSFVTGRRAQERPELPVTVQQYSTRTINFKTYFNSSLFFSNATIKIVNSTVLLRAAQTNLPLSEQEQLFPVPLYNYFSISERAIGEQYKRLSESMTVILLILCAFLILKNRVSEVYYIFHYIQHLYLLSFLKILYPPNLGMFLLGFANSHFVFIPPLFSAIIPADFRLPSPPAFFVNSVDVLFLRNAGHNFTILIIVCSLVLASKACLQLLIRIRDRPKATVQPAPEIVYPDSKKELQNEKDEQTLGAILFNGSISFFKGIKMRFRWHHTNDLIFLLSSNLLFFGFAQLLSLQSSPLCLFSVVLGLISVVLILFWSVFVLRKLNKHKIKIVAGLIERNLTCFYQGMQPVSRLGIFYILFFYMRKFIETCLLSLAQSYPLYVLPVLMLDSLAVALLVLYYRPFLLNVVNLVTVAAETVLIVLYIVLTVISYHDYELTSEQKFGLGWLVVILGVFLIIGLCIFLCTKLVDPDMFEGISSDDLKIKQKEILNDANFKAKENFQGKDEDGDVDEESELDSQDASSVGFDFNRRGIDIDHHKNFIHYSQSSQEVNMEEVPKILIKCVKNPDYKQESVSEVDN